MRFLIIMLAMFSFKLHANEVNPLVDSVICKIEMNWDSVFVGRQVDDSGVLVFPVGSKNEAYLFEVRDSLIENVAIVEVNSSGVRVVESHGGISSYNRVRSKAQEILGSQFLFIESSRLRASLGAPEAAD